MAYWVLADVASDLLLMGLMTWHSTLGTLLAITLAGVACRDDREVATSQLERGEKLYRHHCAACHGIDGKGGRVPSAGEVVVVRNLTDPDFQAARSDQQLRSALKHGKHHMPAFGDLLNATQEKALVRHIRVLGETKASRGSAALDSKQE